MRVVSHTSIYSLKLKVPTGVSTEACIHLIVGDFLLKEGRLGWLIALLLALFSVTVRHIQHGITVHEVAPLFEMSVYK